MSRREDIYKPALTGKNVPILTLDNKWHRIFTQTEISNDILKKEAELNELLARQGKMNNESKQVKKLKAKLMNEIVELMGEDGENSLDAAASQKQSENKRLIQECNEKIDALQDDLIDIDKEIHEVNYELMLMSMDVCYETLAENTEEIQEIDKWINQIRIELKKNIVRKQEKEMLNQELYTYMHDIFGPDVIDIFDMKYNPGDQMLKKAKNTDS